MSGKFPFGKKDEKKKEVEEVKDMQQAALEDAKRCLHSAEFKKLLGQYKQAERSTVDVLLKLSKEEHDPLKFGYAAKDLLITLSGIKAMLDVVHRGAGEVYTDV